MDLPNTCLGIPLPKDIRNFISNLDLPVCLSDSGDTQVMRLIQDFGTKNKCDRHEILKAQELAAGLPDIAVLLQRPTGKYNLPFSRFVEDCETLRAVDELIRIATRGARSIHTTTVVDLFMLKPQQSLSPSDQECFELLGRILEMKRPKVVLCCLCKKKATGHWVDEFMSSGIGAWPIFESYQDKFPITTTRYFSFHPSKAMNYEPCDVYYRILLVMHFIFAFRKVQGRGSIPQRFVAWMQEISDDAKIPAQPVAAT